MAFQGFGPQGLPFLKALAFHQSKDWYEANKATYESDLKTPMGDLVEALAEAFARSGPPLKGDRKTALFRLHRDVRFAKDKSPYKTHVGAVMTRSGAKNDSGLLYIHIEPGAGFTAAGFYDPAPESLARLRAAMTAAPASWKKMLAALAKADLAPEAEYAMKRNPRGFEGVDDETIAAAVRLKSLVVRRPLPDSAISSPQLVSDILAFARAARPLLDWGWRALA